MPGHRPFRALRGAADTDPVRRARVDASRSEAEKEQYVLAELRRARMYTQEQLAASLDVPQSQISRIEHQTDLYVSTLTRYVAAMGGQIEIIATFEDNNVRMPLALADLDQTPEIAYGEAPSLAYP